MRSMKKSVPFILVLLVFAFACKKEESTPSNVKTGDKLGLYFDKVDTISPKAEWRQSDSIDINKDGKIDIKFVVSALRAMNGYSASSGISITDSTFQFVATKDSLSPKILNKDEVLDNNQFWLFKKSFKLADDSKSALTQSESNYSYWEEKTGYIGFRNEYKKGNFKYGCLKISVASYSVIYLHEYSYQE